MGGNEKKFRNNSKMREFWEKRIYSDVKYRWDNGFMDYFTLYNFFSNQYDNIVDDWNSSCYGGMGSDDEDLITDFTRDYPVIEEMVNSWGYDIEYSIIEYMDIMRKLKDKLRIMNETKRTIKKILKEEVSRKDKLLDIIINSTLREFNRHDTIPTYKQPTPHYSYSDLKSWMDISGRDYITNTFGLKMDKDIETITFIEFNFYSIITGLPLVGSRIRLIKMEDIWTKLKEGDEGIVLGYNPSPWGDLIMMKWDSGSSLDIDPNEDEYEVLSNS